MFTLIKEAIVNLFDIHKLRRSDTCPLNSLQADYIIKSIEGTTIRVQKVEKLLYIAIILIITIGYTNIATSNDTTQTMTATSGILAKLKHYNEIYCSDGNEVIRDTLAAIIRSEFPGYPAGGLCKEEDKILKMLPNTSVKP